MIYSKNCKQHFTIHKQIQAQVFCPFALLLSAAFFKVDTIATNKDAKVKDPIWPFQMYLSPLMM